MNYIVIFFSQSGAIKFNKQMINKGIKCILSPTPRTLSSSCGTCANILFESDINELIEDEIESIYSVDNKRNYMLLFDNHN
ncbi:DUF3343 domain-containing protein [Sedimentibacter sp. zth1]|uniref:DUF3343 domain-containing protein n=1 Tax=Sedimentibacter sp. zth1 TaxID=2816908 RepID=UPI001A911344|nr:DUF3343 domain-containing protein [Sedimentibacter sp. zth1]QSX07072.1 DUF3343 domain-containing protein [Sedimentibacter sp. zth1]